MPLGNALIHLYDLTVVHSAAYYIAMFFSETGLMGIISTPGVHPLEALLTGRILVRIFRAVYDYFLQKLRMIPRKSGKMELITTNFHMPLLE